MATLGRSDGLRTIFSIFLGLMLTAFVGIGVFTFLPPPDQHEREIRDLSRREQVIREGRPMNDLSEANREQLRELGRDRAALADAATEARKPWERSTSIVLVVFATLIMVLSLVRADALPVISSGLLLGGVFTMLYGVGWIVNSDASVMRFGVMTAALVITLGLGYFRFVRLGSPAPAAPTAVAGEGNADLERRVRELESRLDDTARALGARRDGAGDD